MPELIESPHVLRNLMGNHFELIKRLDPLPRERGRTGEFRQKLISKFGEKCGYCSLATTVDAAHLIPLEIGGTTEEENLILLCRKCHSHFDAGALSIRAMLEVAKEWRSGTPLVMPRSPLADIRPPSPTITEPPSSVGKALERVLLLQKDRKWVKAIGLIDDLLKDSGVFHLPGCYYLLIKRAELTRRRAARGVLEEALRSLQDIDQNKLPEKYWPVFYYEYGYVQRLRGYHAEAARLYHLSGEAAVKMEKSSIPPLGYIAASVNEILCRIAERESLTQEEVRDFENRLNELERTSARHGQYWGGRWALNCAAHRLQLLLKISDKNGSWWALERLRDLYYRSDLSSGWDSGARQSVSLLEGLTRTFFPHDSSDLDTGIGLLARSFVTRLGPRQRPEGIRDVGFGLIDGFRKKVETSMEQTCLVLEGLMNRTLDGTSVLWSWRVKV